MNISSYSKKRRQRTTKNLVKSTTTKNCLCKNFPRTLDFYRLNKQISEFLHAFVMCWMIRITKRRFKSLSDLISNAFTSVFNPILVQIPYFIVLLSRLAVNSRQFGFYHWTNSLKRCLIFTLFRDHKSELCFLGDNSNKTCAWWAFSSNHITLHFTLSFHKNRMRTKAQRISWFQQKQFQFTMTTMRMNVQFSVFFSSMTTS